MKVAEPNTAGMNKNMNAKPLIRKPSKLAYGARKGLEAGLFTVGLNYLLFPSEVKSGIKTTLGGQDRFISKTLKQAGKAAKKAGETINKEEVAEKAKNVFPAIVQKAKPAMDTLGKAFFGVAAGVFAGNLISEMIIDKHVNKK